MKDNNNFKGYVFAFLSYLIWGVLPIYWHLIDDMSSVEILFSRQFFSTITLLIFIKTAKHIKFINYLKDKSIRTSLIASSLLLCINWGVYVYAVNSGNVLQASLGYYINPLVSVLLGVVIFKEKLTKIKIIAIIFALIGASYMTLSLGQFPYISFLIAFSFGIYALIKKKIQLDSYNTLLIETGLLTPIAILYTIFGFFNHTLTLTTLTPLQILLVLLSGVVTVIPLLLFNEGAKRIPLSSIGILQYSAPTLMLLIGVLLFGETFTQTHAISFAFIWTGYIIYVISLIKKPATN